MSWKKGRDIKLIKNKFSCSTKKNKRIDLGDGGEIVYLLSSMSVTFPTSHAEISPLKASFSENTATPKYRKIQILINIRKK